MFNKIPIVAFIVIAVFTSPVFAYQSISPDLDLDLLWSQMYSQPEDFAVGCVPLYNPIGAVIYNGDEAFPLASVGKLVTFVEYARQVDAGNIRLGEIVPTATLTAYALDRTDGGAHQRFIDSYEEGTNSLSLWEVASEGMMGFSSNSASDYVLARLNNPDWNALYGSLNMTNTSPPHPLNLVPLMMSNHETGRLTVEDVQSPTLRQDSMDYFYSYILDKEWRDAELDYRQQRRRGFPEWEVQQYVLQNHTMTGSVRDFVFLMSAIYDDTEALSPGVQQLTREAMRWSQYDYIDNTYIEYGSKLGFYSGGTLTLVAYGDPWDSDPVISVAFFRNIPRWSFYDILRSDQIGDFAHWMNLNTCEGLSEKLAEI